MQVEDLAPVPLSFPTYAGILARVAAGAARELNLNELLTLSTQAFTYFQSKGGFSEGTPDDLPPARRDKYDTGGRNSKVLVKKLTAETAQGGPPTKPVMATLPAA